MRIGIDARFYGSFGKGLGRYTEKLIKHLEKIDYNNNYYIFLRKENWASYQPANKKFTKVLADYKWYSFVEQVFFPLKIWQYRVDLMHFTHFNVPFLYYKKFIVTIHDLILAKYPTRRATTLSPISYKIKHIAYSIIIKSAVRRAKKIIAVSKYTKRELVRHFNLDPEKISVTYEAVDPTWQDFSNQEEVLKKYHVLTPYILYVGNVYPHKNIEGLLVAFKQVLNKLSGYKLVLVGKDDYFFKRLKKEVKLMDLEEHVIFTGFVTDHDLPYLYKNAALYIFPSFCEGFGLPALEACSYGIPVAASNSSCLPEVLDKAAIYFNPKSTAAIADAIINVLTSKKIVQELRRQGLERVKFFSWETLAKKTLDLYAKK
ncbi:glycosyltransferase family 4 protein [Patescibacteria group bacterium]|nr:glycosyltransferase family 4 protein [Patescibacteria group bacterium]